MTIRGDFNPTGYDPDDIDTWPTTERDQFTDENGDVLTVDDDEPLTDDDTPVYFDGDQWNVTGDGPFEGLGLTTGGRLFARTT